MDRFGQQLHRFAAFYDEKPETVFLSPKFHSQERWYKELLVDVLGTVLSEKNIRSGDFRRLLIDLITDDLDWRALLPADRLAYYEGKTMDDRELSPSKSFYNMLSGTFQIWTNFKELLEDEDEMDALGKEFLALLYGKDPVTERVDTFKSFVDAAYKRLHESGGTRLSRAPRAPKLPLKLISMFLWCVEPDKYFYYKPNAYVRASEAIGIPFEKGRTDGETFERAMEFAGKVRERLRTVYPSADGDDAQSFIYVLSVLEERESRGREPAIESEDREAGAVELVPSAGDFMSEADLERYVAVHWDEIERLKGYALVRGEAVHGGQYRTDTGSIDLLGYSERKKEWLVIELKHRKSRSGDDAVGQLLRYMGYIKERNPDENVRGLLVIGSDDLKTRRAAEMVGSIDLMVYSVNIEYKDFTLRRVGK